MKQLLMSLVLACLAGLSQAATVYYVAPHGQTVDAGGLGTLEKPYDLETALTQGGVNHKF